MHFTAPDLFPVETGTDQPGISLRSAPGFDTIAERMQDTVTGLRADIAAVGETVLYTTPDPGYPNATVNTTSVEMTSMRLTVPAADYERLIDVTCDQMFHYSQIERYDIRLYLNAERICIINRYDSPAGVFRSTLLAGKRVLAADTPGVVEIRHCRVGGTGQTTPSAGSLSWNIAVEARRV